MHNKKWTDEDTRWLKANRERMDLQSLSHSLGFPLAEVEAQLKLIQKAPVEARHKAPGTLKEAVKELSAARRDYEKAIEAFHKRKFDEAAKRFEEVLEKHPDEKDILDRARMYLAASNKKKAETNGHDGEDLFHAAVFEKNRGDLDRALDLVKRSNGKRDADGRLHYLAACCHALVGDAEQALQNLRRAVAADQQNRIQARLESDLASLRGTPEFAEIVTGA
ncbi:MAG: hypothetical protein JNK60_14040 [Acidobacteria bacterium]|nr:hypothetical protein [Acidobacteriota bacterium]